MKKLSEDCKMPDTCKEIKIFPVPADTSLDGGFLARLEQGFNGQVVCSRDEIGGYYKIVITRGDDAEALSEEAKHALEDLARSRTDMSILFYK